MEIQPETGKQLRKHQIQLCIPGDENVLFGIWDDGELYLTHVEIDIYEHLGDYKNGKLIGRVMFNGEIKVPMSKFKWIYVESEG